jgi:hypothetical protein
MQTLTATSAIGERLRPSSAKTGDSSSKPGLLGSGATCTESNSVHGLLMGSVAEALAVLEQLPQPTGIEAGVCGARGGPANGVLMCFVSPEKTTKPLPPKRVESVGSGVFLKP